MGLFIQLENNSSILSNIIKTVDCSFPLLFKEEKGYTRLGLNLRLYRHPYSLPFKLPPMHCFKIWTPINWNKNKKDVQLVVTLLSPNQRAIILKFGRCLNILRFKPFWVTHLGQWLASGS